MKRCTSTVGAGTFDLVFGTGVGEVSTVAELQTALAGYPVGMGTASVDTNGNITLVASGNNTIEVSPSTTAVKFGMNVFSALPANGTVRAQDLTVFLDQSIGGGAVTAFDVSGSPVNIQLRWAKVDSADYGGTDTWNLFYQTDSSATGAQSAWQNVGVNYMFGANGQMDPVIGSLTLSGVTVNGIALGDVQLVHGSGGITQFADANGSAKVNILQQNGFPAGELQQVSVSDKGRIVGSYSNGRTIDLAEITLANFNGANYAQAHRRRRLRGDRRIRPRHLRRARQDRRFVAGRLQHRHRRRVHQADHHAAGLFGEYAGHFQREPDGSGPPEHAALIPARVAAGRT